jgi:hypothetical protein
VALKIRALALAMGIAALPTGPAQGAVKAVHKAPPSGPIAIVLNGERLSLPPPRFYKNYLLVPVRGIIEALGLDFLRDGRNVVTHAGYKLVSLHVGDRTALVDGEPVVMDVAPVEIKDVLYASLRFFTDVLGAQASFDPKARTVTIVAQLIGRTGDGIVDRGKAVEQVGTVTAIDVNSDPPTITITYNASVRTVPVAPNAEISLQDVNANVTIPGELTDVRPGDFAHLYGSLKGVDRIVDSFGSRVGTIEAVAGGELVLDDGHVIVPDRTTRIALNGAIATIDVLQRGDRATIRYNIDSGEIRELLASRAVPAPIALPGAPTAIVGVETDAVRPLRAGDTLTVTLHGEPSGAATFDIGPYVNAIAMSERSPGTYVGSYVIPRGANFADVPVIAQLRAPDGTTVQAQAPNPVSASSVPPGVSDFAPDAFAVVNNSRPAIYATFSADAVPVNPSSVVLYVNGRDVTSGAIRTPYFIQYMPGYSYPDGPVRVTVRVADLAGNVTTKSWSFTIRH